MRTIHREIVGAFIFSADGKILLGKTGAYEGYWVVPGGGIDAGETKLAALKREVLEETGLDIEGEHIEPIRGKFTGQSEKTLRDSGERVLVDMRFHDYKVVLAKPADQVELKTDDDLWDAGWFSMSEIKTMKLSPPTLNILQKFGYL